MRERIGLEVKVGLLALIGLTILAVLVFSIGDYNLFQKRKHITLSFNFAGGVETSAPVRLAGVKVGEVQDIQLSYDDVSGETSVQIMIWIARDAAIYQDADVYINTLGLLGEKYIEILSPGTPAAQPVPDGGTIRGHDPVPIEQITQSTHEIVSQLEGVIAGLNDVIGDDKVRDSLKNTLYNFEVTSDNLKDATGKLRAGEGTLGNLMYNDSLYNELEGFARDIRLRPWRLLKRDRTKSIDKAIPESSEKSNKGFIN